MITVLIVASTGGLLAWIWWRRRDPLVYLVPLALAFPPLFAYGAHALGWPGGWVSTRKALVASIVIYVLFRWARRDFSYRRIPGIWFITPYLALVAASVLWGVFGRYNSDAATLTNEFVSWLIPVIAFLLIAAAPREEADIRAAARVLIVVGLIEAIYSGLQLLVLTGNGALVPAPVVDLTLTARQDLAFGALRSYGTLPNVGPNFFGAFILFPTVLVFARALSSDGLPRVALLLGGLAGIALVAATYSRGAMLGLGAALLVLPLWRRSGRGALIMVATTAVVVLGIAQTPVGRHAASLYTSGQFDVSAGARVDLWRSILSNAADHPVGLGFNGWPRESRARVDIGYNDPPARIGTEHPAENQWMRELADRGLLGIAALLLMMIGLIRLTLRAASPIRSTGWSRDFICAVGAATVGWCLTFLTGDHLMFETVAGMFWYTSAIALAAIRDTGPATLPETHTDLHVPVGVADGV